MESTMDNMDSDYVTRSCQGLPGGRHERTEMCLGSKTLQRMHSARVLVVGTGGLGFPLISYLAAMGVGSGADGYLALMDDDLVEVSNLGRQLFFGPADVGQPKLSRVCQQLSRQFPDVNLNPVQGRFPTPQARRLLAQLTVIVDCTDSFDSKYAVADAAAESGAPLVWGSVVGSIYQYACFASQPSRVAADIRPASASALRDLFPTPPEEGVVPCAGEVGVLPSVVGEAGAAMASQVAMIAGGFGQPLWDSLRIEDPVRGLSHRVVWR